MIDLLIIAVIYLIMAGCLTLADLYRKKYGNWVVFSVSFVLWTSICVAYYVGELRGEVKERVRIIQLIDNHIDK